MSSIRIVLLSFVLLTSCGHFKKGTDVKKREIASSSVVIRYENHIADSHIKIIKKGSEIDIEIDDDTNLKKKFILNIDQVIDLLGSKVQARRDATNRFANVSGAVGLTLTAASVCVTEYLFRDHVAAGAAGLLTLSFLGHIISPIIESRSSRIMEAQVLKRQACVIRDYDKDQEVVLSDLEFKNFASQLRYFEDQIN